jgi:hypothetical protein
VKNHIQILEKKGGSIVMPREISRAKPGCMLFLIDQSGSMCETFGGDVAKKKSEGVADAINRLLQNLVNRCSKGDKVRDYFDVGVIGYGESGVGPAFGGALSGRDIVPISEVANHPAKVEDRMQTTYDGIGGTAQQPVKFPVWFYPVSNGGTPMSEALDNAYRIIQDWVQSHASSYPPIVINITDGNSTSTVPPTGPAQKLTSLNTQEGNVLLFNCHISATSAAPIMFPDSEKGLPDEVARMLFNMSSILPEDLVKAAQSEGFKVGNQSRGFAFNADLVKLIGFINIGTLPANLSLR